MQFHHQGSVSGAESTGDQCCAQGSCPQDTLRLSLLLPAAVREGIQGVCATRSGGAGSSHLVGSH